MIRMIPMLLLVTALAGCTELKRADPNPKAGEAIVRIDAGVDSLQGHVENAKPYTSGQGQQELLYATNDYKAVKQDISKAKSAQEDAAKAYADLDDKALKLDSELKAERDHWAGYKLRVWAKVAVGVWAVLGIASVLLNVYGGGAVAGIGSQIMHLLPVSNLFAWGVNYLNSRKGTNDETASDPKQA